MAPLQASRLRLTDLPSPKDVPDLNSSELANLKTSTDRMIEVNWSASSGWAEPQLIPYAPITLVPTASALQYATECFEGMKVYRGHDDKLRLFRPMYNCRRMRASAQRVTLPTFDPEELLKLIHALCGLEAPKWLPIGCSSSSLYIRPTLIGTDSSLGFKVPDEARLIIFMVYWPSPPSKVPPSNGYSGEEIRPSRMRLITSSESAVRSWPGGTGAAKIGGNYGLALREHAEAKRLGYDQVLWLFGPDRQVTEAGSTNVFIVWRKQFGGLEMVTCPVDKDGLILAGNTRRSIIELSREMFDVENPNGNLERCGVSERVFTMAEVESASKDGRLVSMFAVGTAFWIQEIGTISHQGFEIDFCSGESPYVTMLRQRMFDIMYGIEDNDWAELVKENNE